MTSRKNFSGWEPASFVVVNDGEEAQTVTLRGRDRWTLERLIAAGEQGCTPIDDPAPRWSGYVHNLRCAGVVIETIHERHDGPFAGTHARYVLRSSVARFQGTGEAA